MRCPVCSAQLPLDNTAMNAHIGEKDSFASIQHSCFIAARGSLPDVLFRARLAFTSLATACPPRPL